VNKIKWSALRQHLRTPSPDAFNLAQRVAGVALIGAGIALFSIPVALIVLGVLLVIDALT
jgi:hypothetical protein